MKSNKSNRRRTGRGRASKGRVDRAKIIAITAGLFRRQGYHGTSMQDISDEVGILKGSLYHHIERKEELLLAVLEEYVKEVHRAVREVADTKLPPRAKLRQMIKAELQVMAAHQDAIVVWSAERGRMRELFAKLEARTQQVDQMLRNVIRSGVKSGVWDGSNERIAAQAIVGMIAYFATWFRPDGELSVEQVGDLFADYADRMLTAK